MLKTIIILFVLAIFFSPVFLFIKMVKKRGLKQKESSWKGKLVDKKHLKYEDDDSSYTKDLYTLYFETTKKEQIKINVSQKVYDSWKVNDKAEKIEGKLLPEKIA